MGKDILPAVGAVMDGGEGAAVGGELVASEAEEQGEQQSNQGDNDGEFLFAGGDSHGVLSFGCACIIPVGEETRALAPGLPLHGLASSGPHWACLIQLQHPCLPAVSPPPRPGQSTRTFVVRSYVHIDVRLPTFSRLRISLARNRAR